MNLNTHSFSPRFFARRVFCRFNMAEGLTELYLLYILYMNRKNGGMP